MNKLLSKLNDYASNLRDESFKDESTQIVHESSKE